MQNFTTEKDLKKHLKRRVGGEFSGASKELREIFGVGHLSMFGKEKASKMTLHLIWGIKPKIERREITSIEQLDDVINEQFSILRQIMECPLLKIKIYKPSTKATVSAHRGTKKAGGALAGGLLLGPVGAIAGYGLGSGDGSSTKEIIINNDEIYKDARIAVFDNELQIYNKMVRHEGTMLFNSINSIDWEKRGQKFRISTEGYGTIVISSKDASLNRLFDELMFKFHKFQTPSTNNLSEPHTSDLCTNCGSPLEDGANFCSECGQKIN